jgi:hypothetical protein
MKRKDALTDLVEHAQSTPASTPPPQPSDDRTVVNNAGETITLGQKPSKTSAIPNKGVLLELSESERASFLAAIRTSVIEAFDRFIERHKQNKEK